MFNVQGLHPGSQSPPEQLLETFVGLPSTSRAGVRGLVCRGSSLRRWPSRSLLCWVCACAALRRALSWARHRAHGSRLTARLVSPLKLSACPWSGQCPALTRLSNHVCSPLCLLEAVTLGTHTFLLLETVSTAVHGEVDLGQGVVTLTMEIEFIHRTVGTFQGPSY